MSEPVPVWIELLWLRLVPSGRDMRAIERARQKPRPEFGRAEWKGARSALTRNQISGVTDGAGWS